MPDIDADGCRLSWAAEGPPDAPALLLLDALGTTVDLWRAQIDRLSAALRVIRFDTRGHGASDAPAGPYALDRLGQDALAVLDAAGAPRAHVCGVSLGGQIALWLALHAPERVAGVVAANTGAKIGTTALWNRRIRDAATLGMQSLVEPAMARWFTPRFQRTHPETVDRFRTMLGEGSAAGYAGCCAALRDADLRADLHRIEAPTLVVVGAEDSATPPAAGRAICEHVAGAELLALDAAHLANVERPGAFTVGVLGFLARIPAPPVAPRSSRTLLRYRSPESALPGRSPSPVPPPWRRGAARRERPTRTDD